MSLSLIVGNLGSWALQTLLLVAMTGAALAQRLVDVADGHAAPVPDDVHDLELLQAQHAGGFLHYGHLVLMR